MSTTTFGDALFDDSLPVTGPFSQPSYDNYIVGSATRKDFFRYGGLVIAGEIGIADRFGDHRRMLYAGRDIIVKKNEPELTSKIA